MKDLRSTEFTGLSVYKNSSGGFHVTIWNKDNKEERFSYDVNSNGAMTVNSAHYTDLAAKLLGKDTIGPDATKRNRW